MSTSFLCNIPTIPTDYFKSNLLSIPRTNLTNYWSSHLPALPTAHQYSFSSYNIRIVSSDQMLTVSYLLKIKIQGFSNSFPLIQVCASNIIRSIRPCVLLCVMLGWSEVYIISCNLYIHKWKRRKPDSTKFCSIKIIKFVIKYISTLNNHAKITLYL